MQKIECLKYNVVDKGSLVGFVNIYVPRWGLEINGLAIFTKNGNRWINFPSKEYLHDGVKKYFPYIRFHDENHKTLFELEVFEAIDIYCNKQQQQQPAYVQEEVPF